MLTLKMEYPGLVSDGECTVILVVDSNYSTLQLDGCSSRPPLHLVLRLLKDIRDGGREGGSRNGGERERGMWKGSMEHRRENISRSVGENNGNVFFNTTQSTLELVRMYTYVQSTLRLPYNRRGDRRLGPARTSDIASRALRSSTWTAGLP